MTSIQDLIKKFERQPTPSASQTVLGGAGKSPAVHSGETVDAKSLPVHAGDNIQSAIAPSNSQAVDVDTSQTQTVAASGETTGKAEDWGSSVTDHMVKHALKTLQSLTHEVRGFSAARACLTDEEFSKIVCFYPVLSEETLVRIANMKKEGNCPFLDVVEPLSESECKAKAEKMWESGLSPLKPNAVENALLGSLEAAKLRLPKKGKIVAIDVEASSIVDPILFSDLIVETVEYPNPNLCILSWRRDDKDDRSHNLYLGLLRGQQRGYRYVAIDYFNVDQGSIDITKVVRFSDLYGTLPVVFVYPRLAGDMSRVWILNELLRLCRHSESTLGEVAGITNGDSPDPYLVSITVEVYNLLFDHYRMIPPDRRREGVVVYPSVSCLCFSTETSKWSPSTNTACTATDHHSAQGVSSLQEAFESVKGTNVGGVEAQLMALKIGLKSLMYNCLDDGLPVYYPYDILHMLGPFEHSTAMTSSFRKKVSTLKHRCQRAHTQMLFLTAGVCYGIFTKERAYGDLCPTKHWSWSFHAFKQTGVQSWSGNVPFQMYGIAGNILRHMTDFFVVELTGLSPDYFLTELLGCGCGIDDEIRMTMASLERSDYWR